MKFKALSIYRLLALWLPCTQLAAQVAAPSFTPATNLVASLPQGTLPANKPLDVSISPQLPPQPVTPPALPSPATPAIATPAAPAVPTQTQSTTTPSAALFKIIDPTPADLAAVGAAAPAPLPSTPAPQGQVVTPGAEDTTQEANVYLNFEKATLTSVVNYLGEQKKINIIPNKDLDNITVSLSMRTPLTLDRAWNVLLTMLESNGYTMINVNSVYRIVQSANNGLEPLPSYSSGKGVEPEQLPDSDLVIRYVYFFKNLKAETAQAILSKMLNNPDKNILINKDLNACILKEQCLNIKAAMKIVKELDSGGLREAIEIIPLRWASADTIQTLFIGDNGILGASKSDDRMLHFAASPTQKQTSYFSQDTKILTDSIKNNLILLGPQKSIDRIKQFIYKYLDVPIDDAESRLHVKVCRWIKAQDIQPLITEIIKPPKGAQASDKGLVMAGGYKVFEDVVITAETDDSGGDASSASKRGGGNRLVIACNRDDWRRIEAFIDQIDKPQPQVAIEVLIVDSSVDATRELGANLYNLKGKPPFHGGYFEATNMFASVPKPLQNPPNSLSYVNIANGDPNNASFVSLGQTAQFAAGGSQLKQDNVWALFRAVMTSSDTQIINQPYVVANNNQACSINLVDSLIVNGTLTAGGSTVNPVLPKVPFNIKMDMTITPNINLLGTVDLIIKASIDENTVSYSADQPAKNNRTIETKVSMGTGEVIVFGGLTRSSVTETVNKTPILGDIPILSFFFKDKKKVKQERNLYVFLRPSIIKPRFEGAPDEYTQLKLDYAKYQVMTHNTYAQDRDPIQRWFFKPTHQTIKNNVMDSARGVLKPIDKFTYGQNRPTTVNMKEDPYFRVSESIEQVRARREAVKAKEHAREVLEHEEELQRAQQQQQPSR